MEVLSGIPVIIRANPASVRLRCPGWETNFLPDLKTRLFPYTGRGEKRQIITNAERRVIVMIEGRMVNATTRESHTRFGKTFNGCPKQRRPERRPE